MTWGLLGAAFVVGCLISWLERGLFLLVSAVVIGSVAELTW